MENIIYSFSGSTNNDGLKLKNNRITSEFYATTESLNQVSTSLDNNILWKNVDGTITPRVHTSSMELNNKLYLNDDLIPYVYTDNIYEEKQNFGADGYYPAGKIAYYNGNIYGITVDDSINNYGTIFKYNIAHESTSYIHCFDNNTKAPIYGIINHNDKLYGASRTGGNLLGGILYQYDLSNNTFSILHYFSTESGYYPYYEPLYYENSLYGITEGGTSTGSVLYKYNLSSSTYTILSDFVNDKHLTPQLIMYNNKLYGTNCYGGDNSAGVIFEYDLTEASYSIKYSFQDYSGSNPLSFIYEDNGIIYGSGYGGQFDNGVFYKYNISSSIFEKIIDLDGINGAQPIVWMSEYNGLLYGITKLGGESSNGIMFRYNPIIGPSSYSKLSLEDIFGDVVWDFTTAVNFVVENDDIFYGITQDGGLYSHGNIFTINLSGSLKSKLGDESHLLKKIYTKDIIINSSSLNSDLQTINKKLEYLSVGLVNDVVYVTQSDATLIIRDNIARLYDNTTYSGSLKEYNVTGITASFTSGVQNYLIVSASNPLTASYSVITDVELITESSIAPVLTVYKDDSFLNVLGWDNEAEGLSNKIHQRLVKTRRFERESGMILASTGSPVERTLTITEGKAWNGVNRATFPAFNSSIHILKQFYHSASVWTSSGVTQYDNIHYDDGTNLATLSNNNRYSAIWVYKGKAENINSAYYVWSPKEYSTQLEAELSTIPTNIPPLIQNYGLLVGRIVIQKNSASGLISSAFETVYSLTSGINHNDTGNLNTGEYIHLTANEKATFNTISSSYTPNSASFNDRINYLTDENYLIVGSNNSRFTSLKSAVDYFNTNSIQATTIYMMPGNYYPTDTITVSSSHLLNIEGSGLDIVKLYVSSGLENKPLFQLNSSCYIKKLSAMGRDILTTHGSSSTENFANINASDAYFEIKDVFIDGFFRGININSTSDLWLFDSDIDRCTGSAVFCNSGSIGISECAFHDDTRCVNIYNGQGGYSIENSLFQNSTANTNSIAINYSSSNVDFDYFYIQGNAFYGSGSYLSGFDFTSSKDSLIKIAANSGIRDYTPLSYIVFINNASTTTVTTAGKYYKVAGTNGAQSTSTKFYHDGNNKAIYLPKTNEYLKFILTGNLSMNNPNGTATVAIRKNNDTNLQEIEVRCATAAQQYPFALNSLDTVNLNDYYEIYVTGGTNGDIITMRDMHFRISR